VVGKNFLPPIFYLTRRIGMKLFIDTANPGEIRKAHEMGAIDGVTTNPTLISKEDRDFTP